MADLHVVEHTELVPYAEGVRMQEELRNAVQAGESGDHLLLLEHEPVYTRGRRTGDGELPMGEQWYAAQGIEVCDADRGGAVTYHGPGQLVGYPILRLRGGVVGHLRAMAEGLAAVLAELGVTAVWRRDAPGLWVEPAGRPPAKICAFGVNVHRRVAIHGFALNVTTALDAFDLIVPCGLRGVAVTSIAAFVPAPPLASLAARAAELLGAAYGVTFAREEKKD
ncbi:MAG TPA: lipoyl(octanoyl) transferase LipB [Thermoleophilaceae bacterium]